MFHRLYPILSVIVLAGLIVGTSQVYSKMPDEPVISLVKVNLHSAAEMDQFQVLEIPVYARLHDRSGEFLLIKTNPAESHTLSQTSLTFQVLDESVSDTPYYLVYLRPDHVDVKATDYGRVLWAEAPQYLLQTDAAKAELLLQAGAEINRIGEQPIVLAKSMAPMPLATDLEPNPTIQEMINQVSSSIVNEYNGDLSGEWPVTIDGNPYTIATRYTYSGESIQKATQYVGQHFTDLGLDVEYQQWSSATYPNVIGEITGKTNPDEIYIVSAHLDNMPSGSTAPGADDNGSGSTAALIAADIFSQYEWDCTIRFGLWTGEEQGLNGSEAYAQRAHNQGENIAGVLNLDMIAYDSDTAPILDLHARTAIPGSIVIANTFVDVVDAYQLDLQPDVLIDNWLGNYSDNKSFWDEGYSAILAIEDDDDFTPYYHTTSDTLSTLNMAYFTEFTKAAVGTFAHMTGCLLTDPTGQLEGHVFDETDMSPISNASLAITGAISTTLMTDSTGYYTSTLPTDVYTITVSAPGYISVIKNVVIQTAATTTQDFALPVAEEHFTGQLAGHVFDEDDMSPISNASLTITGAISTTLMTDSTGYYTSTLPTDVYTITASAPGYISVIKNVVIQTAATTTQDFALPVAEEHFTGQLAGYVFDEDDMSPISNASLAISGAISTTLTTDSTGYYTSTLPTNVYTITASAPGYISVVKNVSIQTEATTTQDFALPALVEYFYQFLPIIGNEAFE